MTINIVSNENHQIYTPLVSVIMNCYNGEQYLKEAIESVIAQTYQNWEIIFWDNQSTDKSAEIFNSYSDDRLLYFYAPSHAVLYEARNYAISKSQGSLIAFLDVDDLWVPTKLQLQVPLFCEIKVGLSCGNYYLLNERKKTSSRILKYKFLPSGTVLNELLLEYFVHLSSLVVRRESLNTLQYYFDPRFSIIGDFDLVIRLSIEWELAAISAPITYYRWHEKNTGYLSDFKYSDDLELWYAEAKLIHTIAQQPSFQILSQRFIWLKIIKLIYEGKKLEAIHLAKDIPIHKKIKIAIALILPNSFIRKWIKSK